MVDEVFLSTKSRIEKIVVHFHWTFEPSWNPLEGLTGK